MILLISRQLDMKWKWIPKKSTIWNGYFWGFWYIGK